METVRKHVSYSGSSSVYGLFHSDAVDFDPPTPSLRHNIKKLKAKIVYDLADGYTDEDDENAIRDIMAASENSYELIRMLDAIDGWSGLDDELPEGHVDPIARQLAQVLDQRDYVVYQLVRRYLILLDYGASPDLGDCFARLMNWPVEFQADEIDILLSRKAELLKGVTSATMRQRTNMVNAAHVHPDVIALYLALSPPRAAELVSLMHELNYTTRICTSLERLDYQPLYGVITEMVDSSAGITNSRRFACRDTCKRMSLEFAAAAKAVEVVGSNEAKSTVNRFMLALKAAIDNFPATLPAPTAISAIAAAIGAVATTIADLRTAILNLPDALTGAITLPELTGSGDDDKARLLVSDLHAQGALAHASFDVKRRMINAALDGFTDDDDEISIIRVLEAAKGYDKAELYQLAAAATWESLYSSVDGDEYDTMESILQQPD